MSYMRHGDVMVQSADLSQLASSPRLGPDRNHYVRTDSADTAGTDGGEHYESLGRNGNTSRCSDDSPSQENVPPVCRSPYTRYIRPIGAPTNNNENNNSVIKTSLPAHKKHKSKRTRCQTKHIICSFLCGLVFGIVSFSVCWLMFDRLRETKIVCKLGETDDKHSKESDKSTSVQTPVTHSDESTASVFSLFPNQLHTTDDPSTTVTPSSNLDTELSSAVSDTFSESLVKTSTPTVTSALGGRTTKTAPVFKNTSSSDYSTLSKILQQHSTTFSSSNESGSTTTSPSTSIFSTISTRSHTIQSADSNSKNDNLATTTNPDSDVPESVDKRSVQGGHVYIRWGSWSCPLNAEQIYKGYTASGHWQHSGGATNTICLPDTPSWGSYSDGEDADRNLVYGTEYGSSDASFSSITGEKVQYKDVPCSVCQATGRFSQVMIPGRKECFPGWTQEYTGYLMGSGYIQSHSTELICVDSSPDYVGNSDAVKGGNFLYFAEVRSGSLPSSSYPNGKELACVVCTL